MKYTVLGLLGPAGSGKDLVGDYFGRKGFVKVAYADPMKRFVMSSFNLSLPQLWGPSEERNREIDIDEGWWFNAIGLIPDAADEILNKVMIDGVRVTGYLKLMEWFTWLRKTHPTKISARVILQTLGTEWGRTVDPLMWIRYGHQVAKQLQEPGWSYTQIGGPSFYGHNITEAKVKGVVIPDHRFINEVEFTQSSGGYVIRLQRLAQEEKTVGIAGHKSEAEQKGMPDEAFDLILEVEDFPTQVVEGETVLTPAALLDFNAALDDVYEETLWKVRKGLRHRIKPTAGRDGAPPSS